MKFTTDHTGETWGADEAQDDYFIEQMASYGIPYWFDRPFGEFRHRALREIRRRAATFAAVAVRVRLGGPEMGESSP